MRLQILVMLIALVAWPMVTRPASAEDKTGGVSSRLAGSYRSEQNASLLSCRDFP